MTGMTPERLDTIRANLPTPDADLSRRERDALDLLAEVERLRDAVTEWPELLPGGLSSNGARAWLQDRVDGLLNPTDATLGGES